MVEGKSPIFLTFLQWQNRTQTKLVCLVHFLMYLWKQVETCRLSVFPNCQLSNIISYFSFNVELICYMLNVVVVVVDPTPPTCCQQSPAPESCGSQQSLPPGGKERLHFVGIRPEVQARKGGW